MIDKFCDLITEKIKSNVTDIDEERELIINFGVRLIFGELPKILILFIIGFLLSGIWFSFHIYVSQKLKNTKKALMFSPLLTAIIPTIIIWLLIGDQ